MNFSCGPYVIALGTRILGSNSVSLRVTLLLHSDFCLATGGGYFRLYIPNAVSHREGHAQ